jgi:hypothetical protein
MFLTPFSIILKICVLWIKKNKKIEIIPSYISRYFQINYTPSTMSTHEIPSVCMHPDASLEEVGRLLKIAVKVNEIISTLDLPTSPFSKLTEKHFLEKAVEIARTTGRTHTPETLKETIDLLRMIYFYWVSGELRRLSSYLFLRLVDEPNSRLEQSLWALLTCTMTISLDGEVTLHATGEILDLSNHVDFLRFLAFLDSVILP